MPLSYHAPAEANPWFIHPTPFVNITKNFAKSGSGEILGVTYSITLDGTIMAGMGSPYIQFASTGSTDSDMQAYFSLFKSSMDTNNRNHDFEVWGKVVDQGKEYRALQLKQKLLMNLFSKYNEGGLLHIEPPNSNGWAGIMCYPRFISADFPAHDPGNPNLSKYTIQLETDTLWGPKSPDLSLTWRDYDSFIHGQKWNHANYKTYMIADAQESWDVQESDQRTIVRVDNPEKGAGGFGAGGATALDSDGVPVDFEKITDPTTPLGPVSLGVWGDEMGESLFKSHKVYNLSRTVSAVGKSQFSAELVTAPLAKSYYASYFNRGDQVKKQGTTYLPVYFWKEYNPQVGLGRAYHTREAWQQARGFVYDTLRYGDWFTKGQDQVESMNALSSGFSAGYAGANNDDLDKGGINLDGYGYDKYKGWNYTRTQSVDRLGGSFSVTENWVMAPEYSYNFPLGTGDHQYARNHAVMETVDLSVSESSDSGLLEFNIGGTIEGLVDNASWIDARGNRQDVYWDYEADDDVDLNLAMTASSTDDWTAANPGNTTGYETNPVVQSKYTAAESHFNFYSRTLYQTLQSTINRFQRYKVRLNPRPVSVSNSFSPLTGQITYNFSFNNRPENFLPFALSEDVTVNDTMPGEVFGTHQVLGRTRGPVFQNIKTQTQWERRLSINCIVDTIGGGVGLGLSWDDRQDDDHAIITEANPNMIDGFDKAWSYPERNLWSEEGLTAEFHIPRRAEKVHPNTGEKYITGYLNAMKEKPSSNVKQKQSIMRIINMFRPIPGIDGITSCYMNAPSESWNPRTGAYSLDMSWVYECENPYTQATNGGIPLPGGGTVYASSAPVGRENPNEFNATAHDPNGFDPTRRGNQIDNNYTENRTP